ncbi:hypothetical protein M427DRAFT_345446 [Gonapodya prolifera JEL478]|uniref:Uncharacterized protein n=1 Tax=Gonapodya prolifera (strain JEL478) TaxID=1344416 RepID=A0A139AVR9_GONPJ|nr:hypothetical protein M427DRAFT_345446 [Gonapodya prolifera JEL478]|eukprot:KXS20799.1 hypothetical protein M427DRAFT_345446 [Gonapodya prolifera JEL478]
MSRNTDEDGKILSSAFEHSQKQERPNSQGLPPRATRNPILLPRQPSNPPPTFLSPHHSPSHLDYRHPPLSRRPFLRDARTPEHLYREHWMRIGLEEDLVLQGVIATGIFSALNENSSFHSTCAGCPLHLNSTTCTVTQTNPNPSPRISSNPHPESLPISSPIHVSTASPTCPTGTWSVFFSTANRVAEYGRSKRLRRPFIPSPCST